MLAILNSLNHFKKATFQKEPCHNGVNKVFGKLESGESVLHAYEFDNELYDEEAVRIFLKEEGVDAVEIKDEALKFSSDKNDDKSTVTLDMYADTKRRSLEVPIMETGTWNGKTFTIKDLDAISEAFKETGSAIKPPLKLGHNEEQKLLKSDGQPSAGWVTGLKRVGKRLIAKIENISDTIGKLIENKSYGRISAEIYKDVDIKGKMYPMALRAVSLLGADTPAVNTMPDLIDLYTEEPTIIDNNKEKNNMDEKFEELNRLNEELRAENESIKAEISKLSEQRFSDKVQSFIKDSISAGKMAPSQSKYYEALLKGESVYKFTDSEGKEAEIDKFGIVSKIIELNADLSSISTVESSNYKPEPVSNDPEEQLDQKIKKYMEENNEKDYAVAYEAVAQGVQ